MSSVCSLSSMGMSRGALASRASSAARTGSAFIWMTPASSRDIFSREDTSHWIRSSWMPDVAGEFLPLVGGQILPAEQVGHHQHGGQRRLQLVGDVRQGIGQLQLFRLQLVVVFPQHDGDFVNLAFQDAQLALAVVPARPGRAPPP